jgi:16S rRNA (guanine966-N2)-methyltransferase
MSRLRLTGGVAGGRVLRTPVGPGVRPTTERVREALFSMLGQDLSGWRVLDAFGGTGGIGLEAWSRGASVVVVERDGRARRALGRRGAEVGATWTVKGGDVVARAAGLGRFDLVYVDPPWTDPGLFTRAAAALAPLAGRWYVVEAPVRQVLPEMPGLVLDRRRVYGSAVLALFRPDTPAS